MDDIELSIVRAWERLKDKILSNPDELTERLQRRHSKQLRRWPRPWCLAIRATDTRIENIASCHDYELTDPAQHIRYVPHKVWLNNDSIQQLTALVHLQPQSSLKELADLLGTQMQTLTTIRLKNVFHVKHIPALNGRWGKPHPLFSSNQPLDPCARGFILPDPAWSWTATYLANRLPSRFEQSLKRIPTFKRRGYRDREHLHPEHPANDPPIRPRPPRLPPPQPDYIAWYKWKGDEFLGYDWRNPHAAANYLRHEAEKARRRADRKAHPDKYRKPSKSTGSIRFDGFRWICPTCGRIVNTLYLPIARFNLLQHVQLPSPPTRTTGILPVSSTRKLKPSPANSQDSSPPQHSRLSTPHDSFACSRCHHILHFSRTAPHFWNDVISHLTQGLLYGSEVPRPAWLTRDRKRRYAPKPNAKPPLRRLQLQELLLKGWTYKRIAAHMQITLGTVDAYIRKIYKQHRVHNRYALARTLGVNLPRPPTKRQQILNRLLAGQSPSQIARALNITRNQVITDASYLRRKGLLPTNPPRREHLSTTVR